jgi:hypothetical protein
MHVELGVMIPSLADTPFHAEGTLPGQTQTRSLVVTGSGARFFHPRLFTWSLRPFTIMPIPHLYLGPAATGITGHADGAEQVRSAKDPRFDDSLGGYMFGGFVGTAWSFGPFELRGQIDVGYQNLSFDVESLQTSCKSGTCPASASWSGVYLEPRLYAMALLGHIVSLGAYAAVEVLPHVGFAAGGVFTVHFPDWGDVSCAFGPGHRGVR